MTNWCAENGVEDLFTAHHADDQIENFFIRLKRGSGLFGLVGPKVNFYRKIRILRPFFDIYRSDIIDYLIRCNIPWKEDASNYDMKYLRSGIRIWINSMPEELEPNLFKKRIISSQHHLREAGDYLQRSLMAHIESSVEIMEEGYAIYKFNKNDDKFLVKMVLAYLLTIVSGKVEVPRSEGVVNIYSKLIDKNLATTLTLHGCIILKERDDSIVIYREFGRVKPDTCSLNKEIKWDGRWRSKIDNSGLTVDYLRLEEYSKIIKDKKSRHLIAKLPKYILFTLPVIKYLEKVVAIPHIEYYSNSDFMHLTRDVIVFESNYTSRLINFY
jgi:tRNA(Ile)-lysidine synthase